jgi:hypothetical protein
MKNFSFSLLLGLALPPPPTSATPQCLPEIPVSAVQVAPGAEWTVYLDRPFYLSAARMSSGPPERLAVLRGMEVRGRPKARAYPFDEVGFPQGMWLDCLYGEGGEILISQKVEGTFRQCLIEELKRKRPDQARIQVTCQ